MSAANESTQEVYVCEFCSKEHTNEFSTGCSQCDFQRESGDLEEVCQDCGTNEGVYDDWEMAEETPLCSPCLTRRFADKPVPPGQEIDRD